MQRNPSMFVQGVCTCTAGMTGREAKKGKQAVVGVRPLGTGQIGFHYRPSFLVSDPPDFLLVRPTTRPSFTLCVCFTAPALLVPLFCSPLYVHCISPSRLAGMTVARYEQNSPSVAARHEGKLSNLILASYLWVG